MNIQNIKNQFPFFTQNPDVIYFDSGATAQKPQIVLDAINEYFTEYCANAGRGTYSIANKTTQKIEEVREKVATFINANSSNEIVFTSGATESLNTVAYAWALHKLKDGDEILYSPLDHQSTVLPWIHIQSILKSFNVNIKVTPYKISDVHAEPDFEDIKSKVSDKTKLLSLTHIHNVYGLQREVKKIKSLLPEQVLISLDICQSIGHIAVDVQDLGIDFASFSGHKLFALDGVGVLWISNKVFPQLHPFLVGGGSAYQTNSTEVKYKEMPYLLEAGTPHIVNIISLGAAIDFINSVGIEKIHIHLEQLTLYCIQKLRTVPQIDFLPGAAKVPCAVGYGTIAFRITGAIASDVGFILNDRKMYVRTGNHCVSGKGSVDDSIRLSFHVYNTKGEIDNFISVIKDIVRTL